MDQSFQAGAIPIRPIRSKRDAVDFVMNPEMRDSNFSIKYPKLDSIPTPGTTDSNRPGRRSRRERKTALKTKRQNQLKELEKENESAQKNLEALLERGMKKGLLSSSLKTTPEELVTISKTETGEFSSSLETKRLTKQDQLKKRLEEKAKQLKQNVSSIDFEQILRTQYTQYTNLTNPEKDPIKAVESLKIIRILFEMFKNVQVTKYGKVVYGEVAASALLAHIEKSGLNLRIYFIDQKLSDTNKAIVKAEEDLSQIIDEMETQLNEYRPLKEAKAAAEAAAAAVAAADKAEVEAEKAVELAKTKTEKEKFDAREAKIKALRGAPPLRRALFTAEKEVREMEEKFPSSELVMGLLNLFDENKEDIVEGIELSKAEEDSKLAETELLKIQYLSMRGNAQEEEREEAQTKSEEAKVNLEKAKAFNNLEKLLDELKKKDGEEIEKSFAQKVENLLIAIKVHKLVKDKKNEIEIKKENHVRELSEIEKTESPSIDPLVEIYFLTEFMNNSMRHFPDDLKYLTVIFFFKKKIKRGTVVLEFKDIIDYLREKDRDEFKNSLDDDIFGKKYLENFTKTITVSCLEALGLSQSEVTDDNHLKIMVDTIANELGEYNIEEEAAKERLSIKERFMEHLENYHFKETTPKDNSESRVEVILKSIKTKVSSEYVERGENLKIDEESKLYFKKKEVMDLLNFINSDSKTEEEIAAAALGEDMQAEAAAAAAAAAEEKEKIKEEIREVLGGLQKIIKTTEILKKIADFESSKIEKEKLEGKHFEERILEVEGQLEEKRKAEQERLAEQKRLAGKKREKAVEEASTKLEVEKNKVLEMKFELEKINLHFGYAINSNDEEKIKEKQLEKANAEKQLAEAAAAAKAAEEEFFANFPEEAEEEKEMWPELFEENESLEREREKLIEDALEKNKQENEKLRVLRETLPIMQDEISQDIEESDTPSSTSTETYDLIDEFLESNDNGSVPAEEERLKAEAAAAAEAEAAEKAAAERAAQATTEDERAIHLETIAKMKTVFRARLNKARRVLIIKQDEENKKLLELEVQHLSDLKEKYYVLQIAADNYFSYDQCHQFVRENQESQREDEYIVGLLSRFKQVKNEVGKVDEDYDRLISIIAKEELAFIEILKRLEIIEMKRSHINFITESSINRLLFKLVLRFYCSEKYILANKYKGNNAGLRGNPEFIDEYSNFDSFFPDKNLFFSLFGNYPLITDETCTHSWSESFCLQQDTQNSWYNLNSVLGEESINMMVKLRKEFGEEIISCIDDFVKSVNEDTGQNANPLHANERLFIVQVLCKDYISRQTGRGREEKFSKWKCMWEIIKYEREFEKINSLKSPQQEYWYGKDTDTFSMSDLEQRNEKAKKVFESFGGLHRFDDDFKGLEDSFFGKEGFDPQDPLNDKYQELIHKKLKDAERIYEEEEGRFDYVYNKTTNFGDTLFLYPYHSREENYLDSESLGESSILINDLLKMKRREFFLAKFLKNCEGLLQNFYAKAVGRISPLKMKDKDIVFGTHSVDYEIKPGMKLWSVEGDYNIIKLLYGLFKKPEIKLKLDAAARKNSYGTFKTKEKKEQLKKTHGLLVYHSYPLPNDYADNDPPTIMDIESGAIDSSDIYNFGRTFLMCPKLFIKICELGFHTSKIVFNFWKVMRIYKIDKEIINSFLINERSLFHPSRGFKYSLDFPAGIFPDEGWEKTQWFKMYNFFEKARKALFKDLYSIFKGPFLNSMFNFISLDADIEHIKILDDIIEKNINNQVSEYKEIFYKGTLNRLFIIILMNKNLKFKKRGGGYSYGIGYRPDTCADFPEFNNLRNLGRVCFGDEFIKKCDLMLDGLVESPDSPDNDLWAHENEKKFRTDDAFKDNCQSFIEILFDYLHLDLISILKELFYIRNASDGDFDPDIDRVHPFTYIAGEDTLYTDAFFLLDTEDSSIIKAENSYRQLKFRDRTHIILGGNSGSKHYNKIKTLLTRIDQDERIKYFAETIFKYGDKQVIDLLTRRNFKKRYEDSQDALIGHREDTLVYKIQEKLYHSFRYIYGYEKEAFAIEKNKEQYEINKIYRLKHGRTNTPTPSMVFLENHTPNKLQEYVIAKRDWTPTLEQEIQAFYLGIKLQKLKAGNIYRKLFFKKPIKYYFNGMNVKIRNRMEKEYNAVVLPQIYEKNHVWVRYNPIHSGEEKEEDYIIVYLKLSFAIDLLKKILRFGYYDSREYYLQIINPYLDHVNFPGESEMSGTLIDYIKLLFKKKFFEESDTIQKPITLIRIGDYQIEKFYFDETSGEKFNSIDGIIGKINDLFTDLGWDETIPFYFNKYGKPEKVLRTDDNLFKSTGDKWIKNEFDMIGIEINDTPGDINPDLFGYFPSDCVENIDIKFTKGEKYNLVEKASFNDISLTEYDNFSYNDGMIQDIYTKMGEEVVKYLSEYDKISSDYISEFSRYFSEASSNIFQKWTLSDIKLKYLFHSLYLDGLDKSKLCKVYAAFMDTYYVRVYTDVKEYILHNLIKKIVQGVDSDIEYYNMSVQIYLIIGEYYLKYLSRIHLDPEEIKLHQYGLDIRNNSVAGIYPKILIDLNNRENDPRNFSKYYSEDRRLGEYRGSII